MELYFDRPEQMIKIINWVRENEEIWNTITIPDNHKINGTEMKKLIDLFVREDVSELIFLMLYSQRGLPYVKYVLENMAIYLISLKWDNEKQNVIKKIKNMFNLISGDKI